LHIDQEVIQHEYATSFITIPKTAGSKHEKSQALAVWMQSMFRVLDKTMVFKT